MCKEQKARMTSFFLTPSLLTDVAAMANEINASAIFDNKWSYYEMFGRQQQKKEKCKQNKDTEKR